MTEQNVNRSESVLQVGGNLEITNQYGLSVSEVKELVQIFMRENFPVLRDEAIATAQANVKIFLQQFEQKIAENPGRIDLSKFKNPDAQSSLNDAVLETAKKGIHSNPALLIELVAERLSVGADDYVSLVVSEAIKVVSRLTPEQISFLTLALFFNSKVQPAKSLSDLLPLASTVQQTLLPLFGLSDSKKSYLESVRCAKLLHFVSNSAYSIWKTDYEFLKDIPDEELKQTIARDFPVLHQFARAFDDNKLGQISLTPIGMAIGIANLSKHMPDLKYASWLN